MKLQIRRAGFSSCYASANSDHLSSNDEVFLALLTIRTYEKRLLTPHELRSSRTENRCAALTLMSHNL
jgi:hypothetical protein